VYVCSTNPKYSNAFTDATGPRNSLAVSVVAVAVLSSLNPYWQFIVVVELDPIKLKDTLTMLFAGTVTVSDMSGTCASVVAVVEVDEPAEAVAVVASNPSIRFAVVVNVACAALIVSAYAINKPL